MKETSAETYKPALKLFLEKNGRKDLANKIERNYKVLNRCKKYDDSDILTLKEFFKPDIEKLSVLISRDLSKWV